MSSFTQQVDHLRRLLLAQERQLQDEMLAVLGAGWASASRRQPLGWPLAAHRERRGQIAKGPQPLPR